jgi:branched-chain amino acid transport system substrate-binding protein
VTLKPIQLIAMFVVTLLGVAATPMTMQATSEVALTNTEVGDAAKASYVDLATADRLPVQTTALPAPQPKYGPGANDTEIKIGNIMPYTGPAAAYGMIGRAIAAYFKKVNAEGGINGRKIKFISYDDSYNPTKAIEAAHKLVDDDRVLLIFQSLGTPSNSAIQKYMNASQVPQLFVASGATKWDDPANYPWTMGWQPNYQTEGHIFGQYLLANRPHSRIAILYQDDDYGKDYVKGLKDSLAGAIPIVAEATYETTAANLNAQISKLKASGADVFFNVATPKFAAEAIKRAAEIGWKPLQLLNSVSNSVGSVLKPAGFENAQGVLAANYMKEPGDPRWKDDPAYREWLDFMDRYFPDGDRNSNLSVYGYSVAQTLVQVLMQCGDNLTRENVMKQAANLKGLRLGMLLPGIVINTSATDFAPIEQMQMMRFAGARWEPFGPVLSGIDPGAVSEGLRDVFHFGTGTRATADRLNANTVMMTTGSFGSTYEQLGADLATVLDDGDNFRLLPVVGRGSVQGVADILYLKGVDLGIVRSDTLDYIEKRGYADNIRKKFLYIAKLCNEEMQVVAPKSIGSLAELDGKTVAIGSTNGGTFVTAITIFARLNIKPHLLYIEQRQALEKLKSGEIDAVVEVGGKPLQDIAQIGGDNLHLVPINYDKALQADYLPTQLTADDYPNLIPAGQNVDTIAASAVLAVYDWAPHTDRNRRLELFVDAFFSKIKELQRPPFHPKWREVALNAPVAGWTRFPPAQAWLDRHGAPAQPVAKNSVERMAETERLFRQFLDFAAKNHLQRTDDSEALLHQFLDWRRQQAGATQ